MLFVELLSLALYPGSDMEAYSTFWQYFVKNKLDSICESTNFIINLINTAGHFPVLSNKTYSQLIQAISLSQVQFLRDRLNLFFHLESEQQTLDTLKRCLNCDLTDLPFGQISEKLERR